MDRARVAASMGRKSDEELLEIAIGTVEGYSPMAEELAAEILAERGVVLDDRQRALREELKAAQAIYRQQREQQERRISSWQRRIIGRGLLIVGAASLLLPVLDLQVRWLIPFGDRIPFVGLALLLAGFVLVLYSSDADLPREPEEHTESRAEEVVTPGSPAELEQAGSNWMQAGLKLAFALALAYGVLMLIAVYLRWRDAL